MNYFWNIDIFSQVPKQDLENLSDFCQLQFLQKGEVLFSQGDTPQGLYIVKSGRLIVEKKINNEKKPIAILTEGDIVGEMAYFWEDTTRNASVYAENESQLIVLLDFSLRELLQKHPQLHAKLQQIILSRKEIS